MKKIFGFSIIIILLTFLSCSFNDEISESELRSIRATYTNIIISVMNNDDSYLEYLTDEYQHVIETNEDEMGMFRIYFSYDHYITNLKNVDIGYDYYKNIISYYPDPYVYYANGMIKQTTGLVYYFIFTNNTWKYTGHVAHSHGL